MNRSEHIAEFSGLSEMILGVSEATVNPHVDVAVVHNCADRVLRAALLRAPDEPTRTRIWRDGLPQQEADLLLSGLWLQHGWDGIVMGNFSADAITAPGKSIPPHVDPEIDLATPIPNWSLPLGGPDYSLNLCGTARMAVERLYSPHTPSDSFISHLIQTTAAVQRRFPPSARATLPNFGVNLLRSALDLGPGDLLIIPEDTIHAVSADPGRRACLGSYMLKQVARVASSPSYSAA